MVPKIKQFLENKDIEKQEGKFSPLLMTSCIPAGFKPYTNQYQNFDLGFAIYLLKENHGIYYFSLQRNIAMLHEAYKKYLKVKNFKELVYYKNFVKTSDKINQLYLESHPNKLKILSNNELKNLSLKSFELLRELYPETLFSEIINEDIVKGYFNKLPEEDRKQLNFEEFFKRTNNFEVKSFLSKFMGHLLKHKEELEDDYNVQWVFGDYFLTPRLEEVPSLKKKWLEDYSNKNNGLLSNSDDLEDLNSNLKLLAEFVRDSIKLRDSRRERVAKVMTIISNSIREILGRNNVESNLAAYVCNEDVKSEIIFEKEFKKELLKRKEGMVSFHADDYLEIISGEENLDNIKTEIEELVYGKHESVDLLEGRTACLSSNLISGKVKVVLEEKDFHKFDQDDILITSMTRPEFVPLMEKALAIVTDEGGITCHAAIVSREMNVPCIVGTRVATKVLKDGDLIEVDTEKGIVRKIK